MIWVAHVEWGAEVRWLYSLTDPRDRWWGDDKLAHFFGAALAMCKLHRLPHPLAWIAVIVAIVGVELVELWRWYGWQTKGAPMPWPELCDKVSLKDIAWGVIGAWMATW